MRSTRSRSSASGSRLGPRLPRALATIVAMLACGVLALAGVPGTSGALIPRITNTQNTAQSAIIPNSCAAIARAAGAFWAFPFAEPTATVTATDVSGNNRSGTYHDSGAIGFGAAGGPCPRDGSPSVLLNGSSTGISGTAPADPQELTIAVWFKTATKHGGHLIGFGAPANQSGTRDRLVYMTDAGTLTFGVYSGGVFETAVTTASYNDNAWHLAVATLAASGANAGARLYVDGAYRGAVRAYGSDVTFPTTHYRVGHNILTGWPDRPTSDYFAGRVSFASVYTTALSPTQISTMYANGT